MAMTYDQAITNAIKMSMEALHPDPQLVQHREKIHVFGANPITKLAIGHSVVSDATELLLEAVDSEDFRRDPQVRAVLEKLAKAPNLKNLNAKELVILQRAMLNTRVSQAIDVMQKGITRSTTYSVWDATEPVLDWTIRRDLGTNGGNATVRMFDCEHVSEIALGDKFYIYVDDECIFWGKVVSIKRNTEHEKVFECMDDLWYLRNCISWIQTERMPIQDAFQEICKLAGVPYRETDDALPPGTPHFLCPCRVEQNKSAMDLLQTMMQETLFGAEKQYFVRMSPMLPELIDAEGERRDDADGHTRLHRIATGFDICEAMTSFSTTESITDSTYNNIALYTNIKRTSRTKVPKEQSSTGRAHTVSHTTNRMYLHQEQDLSRISKYGMLTYSEVAQNAIVQEEMLDGMIRILRYPTYDLSVEIVGMINLLPGDTVRLAGSLYLANAITYTYDKTAYKMSIDMARWQHPVGDSWDFTRDYKHEGEDDIVELPSTETVRQREIGDLKSAKELMASKQAKIAEMQALLDSGTLDESSAKALKSDIDNAQHLVSDLSNSIASGDKAKVKTASDKLNNNALYSRYKVVK